MVNFVEGEFQAKLTALIKLVLKETLQIDTLASLTTYAKRRQVDFLMLAEVDELQLWLQY